jgi:DNA-binding response OmpR family regulator
MQANVLVVEDVKDMSDLIAFILSKEGMDVHTCESAEEALSHLCTSLFDIIILDINLPGMDGFSFLEEARKTTNCPVLILSVRSSDEDHVTGLSLGADEYMVKPFSTRVLTARVRALIRRSRNILENTGEDAVAFGPYVMDRRALCLRRGKQTVALSLQELNVLTFLIDHANIPQTPKTIYDAIWKRVYGDHTAVSVYIYRLRRKIEEEPANPRYIITVHGRGYCIITQEEDARNDQ